MPGLPFLILTRSFFYIASLILTVFFKLVILFLPPFSVNLLFIALAPLPAPIFFKEKDYFEIIEELLESAFAD